MDSGANMLKAVHDGGFMGILRRITHLIHLMAQDALGLGDKGDSSHFHMVMRDDINSGRKIAGHFNHSVNGNKLLRNKQAYIGLPLTSSSRMFLPGRIQHLMLEKLLEQQLALHELSRVSKFGIRATLVSAQWGMTAQIQFV